MMNEREALDWLGFSNRPQDDEDLLEALDEQLFLVRKESIAKFMVPALLHKQVRITRQLIAVRSILLKAEGFLPVPNEHSEGWSPNNWLEFLSGYERTRANAMLHVANARTPSAMLSALEFLLSVQTSYEQSFLELSKDIATNGVGQVNSREVLDTGQVLHRIKISGDLADVQPLLQKERLRILGLPAYS
jgi:hypothetical protein